MDVRTASRARRARNALAAVPLVAAVIVGAVVAGRDGDADPGATDGAATVAPPPETTVDTSDAAVVAVLDARAGELVRWDRDLPAGRLLDVRVIGGDELDAILADGATDAVREHWFAVERCEAGDRVTYYVNPYATAAEPAVVPGVYWMNQVAAGAEPVPLC